MPIFGLLPTTDFTAKFPSMDLPRHQTVKFFDGHGEEFYNLVPNAGEA